MQEIIIGLFLLAIILLVGYIEESSTKHKSKQKLNNSTEEAQTKNKIPEWVYILLFIPMCIGYGFIIDLVLYFPFYYKFGESGAFLLMILVWFLSPIFTSITIIKLNNKK